jgi:hypothetical protein
MVSDSNAAGPSGLERERYNVLMMKVKKLDTGSDDDLTWKLSRRV